MKLRLLARHFKGTCFHNFFGKPEEASQWLTDNGYLKETPHLCGCAIEVALKELLHGNYNITERIDSVSINGKLYFHDRYPDREFNLDKRLSASNGYDDTLIKVLEIKGLEI